MCSIDILKICLNRVGLRYFNTIVFYSSHRSEKQCSYSAQGNSSYNMYAWLSVLIQCCLMFASSLCKELLLTYLVNMSCITSHTNGRTIANKFSNSRHLFHNNLLSHVCYAILIQSYLYTNKKKSLPMYLVAQSILHNTSHV